MRVHITGRQLRLTKSLQDYVESKAQKAQKYFQHIIWAQVMLSVEKRSHQAEIVIHASKQTFRARAQAADLYAAIDLATDKIDQQLKRYKERLKGHHKGTNSEEAFPFEDGQGAAPARISLVRQVPLRSMSQDDAIDEMERLGYDFWVFQDRESRQLNVVYRRSDDSYGLLQPVKKGR